MPLKQILYRKHPDSTHGTFFAFPQPSSSAVRYMVAVRMPPMPATMARLPTLMVNCSNPMPAAPMTADR